MDIVTQGVLGATLAQAGARPEEIKKATGIGFIVGLLADFDIFIRSAQDPLLNIEFHRHFTHSLVFIPFGGLIAALLLWPLLRNKIRFKRLYLLSLLGYSGSGLIDACTSYGTHLLWPFSEERIAWSIISVVDPIFSLLLIAALIYGWRKVKPQAARHALALAGCYLFIGFIQHERALDFARQQAERRGHQIERLVVKPTVGNLLLWRALYLSDDRFYVDAVRTGVFATNRLYPGASITRFESKRDWPRAQENSTLAHDIKRFIKLSDGFVSFDPNREGVLIDVRYSMLPNSLTPLWGIDLKSGTEKKHVDFINYRDRPREMHKRFVAMLLGRELPALAASNSNRQSQ